MRTTRSAVAAPLLALASISCAGAAGLTLLSAGCGEEPTVCAGTATPCDRVNTAEACRLQAGCAPATLCAGEPTACADEPAEEACWAQPGCAWQPARCNGTPQACDMFDRIYGGADCERQLGCTWDTATRLCSGTADACDPLNEATCREQNGCSWHGRCAGSATTCSTWTSSAACGTSGGCRWNVNLCTGTAAACSDLPADLCAWQEGCHVE